MNSSEVNNFFKLIANKNSFYLFPSEYFSHKNLKSDQILNTEKTYTIHHYDSAWLSSMNKIRLNLEKLIGVDTAEKIIKFLGVRKIVKLLKLS